MPIFWRWQVSLGWVGGEKAACGQLSLRTSISWDLFIHVIQRNDSDQDSNTKEPLWPLFMSVFLFTGFGWTVSCARRLAEPEPESWGASGAARRFESYSRLRSFSLIPGIKASHRRSGSWLTAKLCKCSLNSLSLRLFNWRIHQVCRNDRELVENALAAPRCSWVSGSSGVHVDDDGHHWDCKTGPTQSLKEHLCPVAFSSTFRNLLAY